MAEINITIKNLPQIKRAFGMAPQLMTQELNKAIKKTVFVIQRRSMMNTPVDTGRLRASHSTLFNSLRGTLYTDTTYDRYVHDGTKYMKARPYMKKAVDDSSLATNMYFTEAVDNVLHKIGKMT